MDRPVCWDGGKQLIYEPAKKVWGGWEWARQAQLRDHMGAFSLGLDPYALLQVHMLCGGSLLCQSQGCLSAIMCRELDLLCALPSWHFKHTSSHSVRP